MLFYPRSLSGIFQFVINIQSRRHAILAVTTFTCSATTFNSAQHSTVKTIEKQLSEHEHSLHIGLDNMPFSHFILKRYIAEMFIMTAMVFILPGLC